MVMSNIHDAHVTPQSRWEATVDEAVHDLTGRDARRTATGPSIAKAMDEFEDFVRDQRASLPVAHGAPPDARLSDEAIDDILAASFGTGHGPLTKGDLGRAVVTANRAATEQLLAGHDSGEAMRGPQVVPFRVGNDIRFSVIKPAPDVENLVLRGGGGKGAGYPPTLVELEKHGVTSGVRQVVGTSAGALTAALLAAGFSADEFQKVSDELDTNSFKNKPPHFSDRYPGVDLGHGLFHGGTALETVDRLSASHVKSFLDSAEGEAKIAAAVADGRISAGDATALAGLRQQNFDADRSGQMVTFRTLDILSKVDPGTFKALTLTGFNKTDGTLAYFNAQTTPDMPIAVAGRISMSIPVFFDSVKYDIGQGRKTWVDGGVGSNMPAGAIFGELEQQLQHATAAGDTAAMATIASALEDAHARTLLMTFDESGTAHAIQHGPRPEIEPGGLLTRLTGHLAGNSHYGEASARDRQRVYDSGPNVVVVHHGDIGTLDLGPSQERKDAASLVAGMRTTEWIGQHQNQATHAVFPEAASGALSLSAAERAQFLAAGPPPPEAFADGDGVIDTALHAAARQFYDEVAQLAERG
jgi:predicted acylesterase/phospholipase RssA